MPVKFSIVTVCLNEPRLRYTCDSIVKQSFQNFEWIVIDGGSKIDTQSVFNHYKYRMDYFVSEKDDGIYHAMNKGILNAHGKWIIFMNGGDYFASHEILAQVANFLENCPECDVLYGEVRVENAEKRNGLSHTPIKLDKYFFYRTTIRHQAAFIKRDMFPRYGLYDTGLKICSDYKYFLMLFLCGANFKRFDGVVAIQDGNGISYVESGLDKKEREEILKGFLKRNELLLFDNLYSKLPILHRRHRIHMIRSQMKYSEFKKL
jgi:glycosyltransferase involved in cell wall biosynthesis